MKIVYHNRNRLSPELEEGATYVNSLNELLASSDVVSLNLPLNANTRHTMGAEQFKRMKETAILVNTARGPVVDEKALVSALEEGQIAGCGLDVYENEPQIEEGLLRLEKAGKAFLLPHVGWVSLLPLRDTGVSHATYTYLCRTLTVETQREMESVCLRQLEAGFDTGKFKFWVPEQKGKF